MSAAESTSSSMKNRTSDHRAMSNVQNHFRVFAHQGCKRCGLAVAFSLGVALIAIWAAGGRWFGYSESWQLVINTGTTIVTFLMVFIIQNTQTRDSRELHVKLDELSRAVAEARAGVIRSDDLTDEVLDRLHAELRDIAAREDGPPRARNTNVRPASCAKGLKRPPRRRSAAHLAEFYRALDEHYPGLLESPEGTDRVRGLAQIPRGHVTRSA